MVIDNDLEHPVVLTAINKEFKVIHYPTTSQHDILRFKLACESAGLQYTIVPLPQDKSKRRVTVKSNLHRLRKLEKFNKQLAKQAVIDNQAIKPMIDN